MAKEIVLFLLYVIVILTSGEHIEDRKSRLILEFDWPEPKKDLHVFPHAFYCSHFYAIRLDGSTVLKKCPSDELFDYRTLQCRQKTEAKCWSDILKRGKRFECPSRWGLFPDTEDCSLFYDCKDGEPYARKCPDNFLFDSAERNCVEAKEAMCANHKDFSVIIQSLLQESIEAKNYGCQCTEYSCGCCAHLEVRSLGLNDTGCVNITYLRKDIGFSFTITIDKFTIFNETISARNPPPICFGSPVLKLFADLCILFYDLDVTETKLHGCVAIEARVYKIVVGKFKLGCFNIGKYTHSTSLGRWSEFHRRLIEKIRAADKKMHKVEFISPSSY